MKASSFAATGKALGTRLRWCALSAALCALPVFANLVGPIPVSLIAPGGTTTDSTPLLLSQNLDYGAPITSTGTGAISGSMLPGEQIALSGDSVLLRAAQGDDAGGTGYLGLGGMHARYELGGLDISGRTLTGIQVFAFDGYATSGFSGVSGGVEVTLIDSNADSLLDTLVFNLDDLRFVDRGLGSSLNYGEFRINILSEPNAAPMPEPGTLVLVVAALLAWRAVSKCHASRRLRTGERLCLR